MLTKKIMCLPSMNVEQIVIVHISKGNYCSWNFTYPRFHQKKYDSPQKPF